jgi:hypothetical protein
MASQVRSQKWGPQLQIEDVIMCSVVRVITQEMVKDEFGAVVEWWLAEENQRTPRV